MKKSMTTFQFLVGVAISLNLAGAFAAENDSTISQAIQKDHSRYELRGDTVYDVKTKLTWARCSVGQQWHEGKGCVGEVRPIQFPAAVDLQKEGWRLPTKAELSTLLDEEGLGKHKKLTIDDLNQAKRQKPAIDVVAFPGMSDLLLSYWTSTSAEDDMVWTVYFGDGSVGQSHQSAPYAVRLVRTDK
ncbi:MAG TPA: DUF1566 domain-containing protein [Burkholderiaceae bacterium]|jgi:hypothetical protein|nr:DUF1566 domain-containing protein [Burkholderiaceae bacterium]